MVAAIFLLLILISSLLRKWESPMKKPFCMTAGVIFLLLVESGTAWILDSVALVYGSTPALDKLRFPLVKKASGCIIKVRGFGDFEVYANGHPLAFSLGKTKEIFAYLVDRKGTKVNGNKICAVVYENAGNETANKSSLRNCVADIKNTLHSVNDGIALCKKVREIRPHTAIVLTTSYDEHVLQALQSYIPLAGYLSMPTPQAAVRELIAHHFA